LDSKFLAEVAGALSKMTSPLHSLRQHPAFALVLEEMKKANLLDEFWVEHVDGTITKASPYRAMIGFFLLEKTLDLEEEESKVKTAARLLTQNVVRTSLAFLSKLEAGTGEEEAVIYGALAKITEVAKRHPDSQVGVLRALLSGSKGGNITFDQSTGGNVVHQLVSFACPAAVKFLGQMYRDAALGKSDGGDARTAKDRIYAAHQLGKLVSHPQMQSDVKWKTETLKFLLTSTLFDLKGKTVKPLDSAPANWSRDAKLNVKDVFFRALDLKAKNFGSVCEILKDVVQFADSKLVNKYDLLNGGAMAPETVKAWKQMMKDVEAIESGRKENSVFQVLYLHMGLQLLSEPVMAKETLQELKACHERSVRKKKSKETGDEPKWVEVVVDVLLSLLAHNKHFLRQLVSSVFSLLCPHMTTDALQAIMEAVNPPKEEGSEGDEQEQEDEDWEDMEEDKEQQEENDEDEDADDSEDEDDEDDEAENEEEGEKDGDVSDELKNKLKNAMGEHAESDAESIDMDDIPDEDMKKMDDALANIFRMLSKKGGAQKKKKEAKESLALTHFKVRALDLIDVYLGHAPSISHTLLIIEFVLAALASVGTEKEYKGLVGRLVGTLKKVTNLRKVQQINLKDDEFAPEMLTRLLQSLVDLGNAGSPLVTQLSAPLPLFAQTAALLLKFAQQLEDEDLIESVRSIYDAALEDFFSKK
jgi:DNA polymerase phi